MSRVTNLELFGFSKDVKRTIHRSLKVGESYITFSKRLWDPNTDIYETPDTIILKLEVAGVKPDDIEIVSQSNKLIIRGNRKETSPSNKQRYHQMQIDYGEFEKILIFPFPVNPDQIKAVFTDGFLEVTIPKEKKDKQEITIRIEY